MTHYYEIAVSRPLGKILSYHSDKKILIGTRVNISLGKATAYGFIVNTTTKPDFETKEILEVSEILYFKAINYKIYKWISSYYHYPIGELLKSIIPSYLPSLKVLTKIRQNIEDTKETSTSGFKFELNKEQKKALQSITIAKTYLLHGVTGSGKTEVYIKHAQKVIANGKSVIVLVPEIALTPQLVDRISKYFDGEIAIIHSALTPKEKFVNWQKILSKKAKLIVGVRSAIFSPVQDLGLIVVDEEHDGSYKQNDRLKYNTRDIAVMMGKIYDIPVILSSATPSVETYFNAYKNSYKYLSLKSNIHPVNRSIKIVDLRKEKKISFNFSESLYNSIKETLNNKQQVLIFLNRRGFSRSIVCTDCGESFLCPNCSIPLTTHKKLNISKCHYCGYERNIPNYCHKCGSHNLKSIGTGTEKLEQELKELFPKNKIKRVDSDILQSKRAIHEFIEEINQNNIDIIIGTQIIIKGHDFKNIGLVGIVNADLSLQIPDFRSAEATFQQIVQVNGRTGRHQDGLIIAQSYMPEYFAIKFALQNDILSFYKQELLNRYELSYPPYTKIADIKVSSVNLKDAKKYIKYVRETINKLDIKNLIVLGPSPAPIEKINNKYRFHILAKAKKSSIIQNLASSLENNLKRPNKFTRFSIDIDPYSLI